MLIKKYILTSLCLITAVCSFAQQPQDFVIPVKTVVNKQQATVTLAWPVNANASSYIINRKTVSDNSYSTAFSNIGTISTGADTATTFTDTDILPGILYEYEVSGNFPSLLPATRNNYLCAGINVSPVHSRGTIILVCDNTIVAAIEPELKRLYSDLVGDGWKVKRIDVDRSFNPLDAAGVRNKIIAAYNLNPDAKQVLIIGHVAVPYSGIFNPDGHNNHYGAWAADGYYGDMVNNNWTDLSAAGANSAARAENRNLVADGKFDQNSFTSVQLGVGRIDFSNMPSFSLSETDLLKRYLNKNHAFRTGSVSVKKRGLIEDNFTSYPEKFSQAPWKSFAATVGFDNITVGQYETDLLTTEGYLWSYGAGAGTYTDCSSVIYTSLLKTRAYNNVFTELFGSYFGDWDSQDNLMRASIASPGYTLACVWGGRPHWYFHHTAAGFPIGYAALLTMNNKGVYYNMGNSNAMVHIGLMGDPSLRTEYMRPAQNLTAVVNKTTVDLNWIASPAANTQGYNIYRSNSITNKFVQLNNSPVTETFFSDYTPPIGNNVYMVRAVQTDTFLASGAYSNNSTYINLSQGVIDSVIFSNIVLPVRLESFNAKLNNCKTELTWKAAAENGIKEYIVEYSSNGSNFKTAGTVNSVSVPGVYSFAHAAAAGKAFYRLKMVDANGKYEYSKIIVLPVNCSKSVALVYPNPVNDVLNVNVTLQLNNSSNRIDLYDAAGKMLYQNKIVNGTNSIDMIRFAKGVYHLKLMIDNTVQNFKIQK